MRGAPDYDGDGTSNNVDTDNDNDGIVNTNDECEYGAIFTSNLSVDYDLDGCHDLEDADDDNMMGSLIRWMDVQWDLKIGIKAILTTTMMAATTYLRIQHFDDDNDGVDDYEDYCPILSEIQHGIGKKDVQTMMGTVDQM